MDSFPSLTVARRLTSWRSVGRLKCVDCITHVRVGIRMKGFSHTSCPCMNILRGITIFTYSGNSSILEHRERMPVSIEDGEPPPLFNRVRTPATLNQCVLYSPTWLAAESPATRQFYVLSDISVFNVSPDHSEFDVPPDNKC